MGYLVACYLFYPIIIRYTGFYLYSKRTLFFVVGLSSPECREAENEKDAEEYFGKQMKKIFKDSLAPKDSLILRKKVTILKCSVYLAQKEIS